MVVWCIGEVLWDVFSDQEHLGGAALNVAANLHRLGADVTLISAVGEDIRGRRALEAIRAMGLDVAKIALSNQPTGVAKVEWNAEVGDQTFVILRPAAYDSLASAMDLKAEAASAGIDWIYFGSLLQANPAAERFTADLLAHAPAARVFYDVNLRDGHWDLALVQRLSRLSSVVKMNEAEAERLALLTFPESAFELESFCESWANAYGVEVMCVTLGERGSFIYSQGTAFEVPGLPIEVRDTVGAGDAFSAAFLFAYHHRWTFADAANLGNALGAFVASRAGAVPPWTIQEVLLMLPPEYRIPPLPLSRDSLPSVESI